MNNKYLLYMDDTGSRDPDHANIPLRHDGMNCFGFGGILVKDEDIQDILNAHDDFCKHWNIDYPLHSSKIRGGQGKFGWLKKPENAGIFFAALQDFLLSLPFVAMAVVTDRAGYAQRYQHQYADKLWPMCQSTFSILVERVAKFADTQNRQLEIYFEESGKKEDRDVVRYMRLLKAHGNPFDEIASQDYKPLSAQDYKRIVLGEPRRKTKQMPLIQLADLVLYPIAKAGYDPLYPPYIKLKQAGKLIDCILPQERLKECGIKYSCFHKE
jgi:hypothetical protein